MAIDFGFITSVGGVITGAIITWVVSRWYYAQAAKDLKLEAGKLKQLTELILYIQLNPEANVSAKRDENGNIVGLIVSSTINPIRL